MEKIRGEKVEIQIPPMPSEVEIPPKNLPQVKNLNRFFRASLPEVDDSVSFHRGSRSGGVGRVLVAWSFTAALIDALILFAVACAFVFTFSVLVKVQILSAIEVFGGSFYTFVLLMSASFIGSYMIMLRVFLGFTIGEWACGLRLGSLKQRLNRYYSLKVLARMFLIFATGLFLLPTLSMLFGRDLPGLIVRLPLIRLQGNS